jgi:enoyl-CoA hydratase/carnithine racemase
MVSRVVPHESLLDEARHTARTILRNDQVAVRQAKQVILDMLGRSLDDQLYRECMACYTLMADNPTVPALLESFYAKSDRGRYGLNATAL